MRRTLLASIALIATIECFIWLALAALTSIFSGFSLGPIDPQVVVERRREGFTEFAWFGINVIGLVAFAIRPWGRWLLAAIQSANVLVTVSLGFGALAQCGQSGPGWFALAGMSSLTVLLQYILWRRVDRPPLPAHGRSRDHRLGRILAAFFEHQKVGPIPIIVCMAVGAALIGLSVQMSLAGITAHSGVILASQVEGDGTHVTLDSTSREFVFSSSEGQIPPTLRAGEQVVILTAESCGYGAPAAVQSTDGTLWFAYSSAADVVPFTPDTWTTHELLRWLALAVGTAFTLVGALFVLRRIG